MADDPSQLFDFNDRYGDPAGGPLFDTDGDDPDQVDIFTHKGLLKVDYVPEGTRIVGRGGETKDIAAELRSIAQNNSPNNAVIYGKTETDKSLVTRHVTGRAH